jgi:Domain of unknown function (DUF4402)
LKKTQEIPLMKNIITLAAVALAMVAAPAFAAGNTAFDTANSNATVVAPVTITKTADLNFGTVIVGHGGVTVDAAGVRTSITGANYLTSGATASMAGFDITGETGRVVLLPIANTSGAGAFDLNATNLTLPSSLPNLTLVAGTNSVKVGGNLIANVAGVYSGTFTLTATYQ